jgi:CDP-6-deoxy-D-xylo-4-hexulose-3-dehydrase
MYAFYLPGFNVRPTDIQATIGLSQMKKIDEFCDKRERNFKMMQSLIDNKFWMPNPIGEKIVNMAYPIITDKREELVEELRKNEIECRPLVCGAMSRQPFIKDLGIRCYDVNAELIDKCGMYIPNHPYLKEEEIRKMCEIVNGVVNG